MGALYLASKLEECPLRMRDLINVYDLLLSRTLHAASTSSHKPFKYTSMSYFSSTFYDLKDALVVAEMQILKRLGFNVHVLLPYGTLVNYLRVLGLTNREDACQRAWGYLNDAYGIVFPSSFKCLYCVSDFRHLFTLSTLSQPLSLLRYY
jgi:cyclin L